MKNINVLNVLAVASVSLLAGSVANAADPIVTNGSFETGDFTGWTTVGIGNDPLNQQVISKIYPNDSSYTAIFGAQGAMGGIEQNVTLTPGCHYTLSFDLASPNDPNDPNHPNNKFNLVVVQFNNETVLKTNPEYSDYVTYSVPVVATGSSSTVTFEFRNDDSYFYLDNVRLTAVPEPSTIISGALLLLPFGASAIRGMRKKQNV